MARQKGVKLGPRDRDNWQIKIDYYKRQGDLEEAKKWEYIREYRMKNLNFIAPYIEKHGEKAGFVYVLKTLEKKPVYKIGKTRSLFSRTNLYHSEYGHTPLEFVLIKHTEDCDLIEKILINLFQEKKARGKEWFWLAGEDIEQLKKYLK